jgi:hypothetical protein
MTRSQKLALFLVPALGLAGVAILSISAWGGGGAVELRAPTSDHSELARSIHALTVELAETRQALARGAESRVVASPDSPSELRPVTSDLEPRLAALVARLGSTIESRSEHRGRSIAGDLQGAPPKQTESLCFLRSLAEDQRSREHLFWTYAQVVQRYGAPDSIYVAPEHTLNFLYEGVAPEPQIVITFFEGLVIRVWTP